MATSTRYGVFCDTVTTQERLTMEVRDGVIVYDSTDNKYYRVVNGSWVSSESTSDLEGFVFVGSKSDLPLASEGIITLGANVTYFFTNHLDLQGDRLVASQNTVILGASSENCSITSTGLGASDFLLSTDFTMPCRHITFKDVPKAIAINESNSGALPIAIDWYGVNFSGCTTNIECGDITNFIFNTGAVLGSGTIIFKGDVDTVGISNSLFTGDGTAYNVFDIQSTATINRRFRIIYSSIVAFSSTVGINFDTSATIGVERYILDTVNFSGGGSYLTGVNSMDNKALFNNNVGIDNSADVSQYYMNGNATATVISATATEYKISGTTTSGSATQKFTNTDNRSTYTGALTRFFKVTATISVTSGNNNEIGLYIGKNGTVLPESEIYGTTNSGGRAENIVCQTLVELTNGDYIEIFCENNTSTSNVTATDLNVIVE